MMDTQEWQKFLADIQRLSEALIEVAPQFTRAFDQLASGFARIPTRLWPEDVQDAHRQVVAYVESLPAREEASR